MRLLRGSPRAALAGVLVCLAAWGCSPPVVSVAPVDRDLVRQRYEHALGRREERARVVRADLNLWITLPSRRRLPGASGQMHLTSPDGFQITIGSALGTALYFSAIGDRVTGYAPGERLALDLAQASDSIGIANPGRLLFRSWTGGWRPEPSAWSRATRSDSVTRVAWSEGGDSVEVAIGNSGLPRAVGFGLGQGRPVTLEYREWRYVEGVAWPSSIELVDDEGVTLLRARVERVQFMRGKPEVFRMPIPIPERAERVTVTDLLERFEVAAPDRRRGVAR